MKDLSLCCVYDNFEKGIDVRNNIEEFLIAAGKKKRPDITLSCYNREYRDIEENFKDTVVIERIHGDIQTLKLMLMLRL